MATHLLQNPWFPKKKKKKFFFWESFNLWRQLLLITLYHQTKTPISFWCRRGLNLRSLIQPSETLPVELIETKKKKKKLQNNFSPLKTLPMGVMGWCFHTIVSVFKLFYNKIHHTFKFFFANTLYEPSLFPHKNWLKGIVKI